MTGENLRGGVTRARGARTRTLRVLDLVQTKVQSIHIELVGGEDPLLDRVGTWTVYIPVLFVGYTLVLGAAVSAVHRKIGWSPSLFLFGAAHLAFGAWGIVRGRGVGVVTRSSVLDPEVAKSGYSRANAETKEDGAIPRLRPTALPSPFPASRSFSRSPSSVIPSSSGASSGESHTNASIRVFPLAESRP